MDCDTARLFLPFDRPGGKDLDGLEAQELHAHLAECSACNTLAMNARRFDQHLGRAVRAVDTPVGMKARILARLAPKDRIVQRRRWITRAVVTAGALAAALLILVCWEVFLGVAQHNIDTDDARIAAENIGASVAATPHAGTPTFVNDAYLKASGIAVVPGCQGNWLRREVKAPHLFYLNPTPGGKPGKPTISSAYVFILDKRFKVETGTLTDAGYRYNLEIKKKDGYSYLILYEGDNWRTWLERTDVE